MIRHGLPDVYPYNEPGFNESQAEKANWVVYKGISDGAEWHLRDGTLLEIWPGGDVFNEHGTLCGRLRQVGFGEKPAADDWINRPNEWTASNVPEFEYRESGSASAAAERPAYWPNNETGGAQTTPFPTSSAAADEPGERPPETPWRGEGW